MSIQGDINQILGNLGVISTLGDKPLARANEDKKRFETARASFKDIKSNLIDPKKLKEYNKEEIENIEKRLQKNLDTIYDLKTEELRGGVYGNIVGSASSKYKHAEIKKDLDTIRKYLHKPGLRKEELHEMVESNRSNLPMLPAAGDQKLLEAADEQKLLEAGDEQKLLDAPEEQKLLEAPEEQMLLEAPEEQKGLPARPDYPLLPKKFTPDKIAEINMTPEQRRIQQERNEQSARRRALKKMNPFQARMKANNSLKEYAQSELNTKEDIAEYRKLLGGNDVE